MFSSTGTALIPPSTLAVAQSIDHSGFPVKSIPVAVDLISTLVSDDINSILLQAGAL